MPFQRNGNVLTSADSSSDVDDTKKQDHPQAQVSSWIYVAFCAEACASVMLTVTFNTFHVETFLSDYKLDLTAYATGHAIYAVINTLNDILGAVILDYLALAKGRAWLLQCGGLLWAVSFLLPWFPWPSYPAIHFVFSLSCYDTMFSFCAIAGGSLLTEMDISDSTRIHVLRVKTIAGMSVGFIVTTLGQAWFPNKPLFRFFCIGIALLSACCFLVFYQCVSRLQRRQPSVKQLSSPSFSLKTVLSDFWKLSNFHAWLGMEMCLETQTNFNRSYVRLFVTHFAPSATWLVSVLPLAKQAAKFAAFSAFDRVGVYQVYRWSFLVKMSAAVFVLACCRGDYAAAPAWLIVAFLALNCIATELPTGGFTVAMSHMNKELTLQRYRAHRFNDPSAAGMFMGLNAVFCKPMDSFLPIVAAKWLDNAGFHTDEMSYSVQTALFHLLVVPPLVMGAFQYWSWSRYTLNQTTLKRIQAEIDELQLDNKETLA
ncbi:hypothetical protein LEN26_011634 [Aphanomyces euteiches]|nr:hypothetical protein LEN26_011634 [Aphanomyces euteiches]